MAADRQTDIHTHNFRKCSHISVGLAQARPNNCYCGCIIREKMSNYSSSTLKTPHQMEHTHSYGTRGSL